MISVTIQIPTDTIVQLFSSAIEGGDPVTTASRGGWCAGIYWKSHKHKQPVGDWYGKDETFSGDFKIEIAEVVDERTGKLKRWKIGPADVAVGLQVMANKFPCRFSAVMTGDIDAPCADVFLQSMLFGEEKYA